MKKLILLNIILLNSFILVAQAQVEFEAGYIINNKGEKIDCFIDNKDWLLNPKTISYKLTPNGSVTEVKVSDLKEFKIKGYSTYKRATVNVDISSDILKSLSDTKEPIFEERTVFLKLLVDGKAQLYMYHNVDVIRFYYSMDNGDIQPLIYKRYYKNINDTEKIVTNFAYKQVLMVNLKCKILKQSTFENLRYNKSKLQKLFINYNKCKGTYEEPNNTIKSWNFGLKVGYAQQRFSIADGNRSSELFTNALRLGVEAEYVLTFRKNSLTIFAEPTFQSMKASNPTIDLSIDYASIEIPLGIRKYINLENRNNRLFIGAAVVMDMNFPSSVSYQRFNAKVRTMLNLQFGLGYNYKGKFSFEIKGTTPRNLLSGTTVIYFNYQYFGATIGYHF